MLVDDIETREVKRLELLLLGGVGDLAVVDNDGPAVAALAVVDGPAKALGELEVGVGGEDLLTCIVSTSQLFQIKGFMSGSS